MVVNEMECSLVRISKIIVALRLAVVKLIFVLALLVVIYFLYLGTRSLAQGYTWGEMDWNQSGSTSITDFFAAADIGKRETMVDGKKCFEYYAYKDGLKVKVNCAQ